MRKNGLLLLIILLFAFGVSEPICAFPKKKPLRFYDAVTVAEREGSLFLKCKTNKKAKVYDLIEIFFRGERIYPENKIVDLSSISKSDNYFFCFEILKFKLDNIDYLGRDGISDSYPDKFCIVLYNTKTFREEYYYEESEYMCAAHTSYNETDKYSGIWMLEEPVIFRNSVYSTNASSFCGSVIEYRNNEIVVNDKKFTIKRSQVEAWDSIRLRNETRASNFNGVTFDDLGIDKAEITVVSLKIEPHSALPGVLLFMIDGSNMITMVGNVYYGMKRVSGI